MASTRTRANTVVQTRPPSSETRILLTPVPPLQRDHNDPLSPPFTSVQQHHTVHLVDLALGTQSWLSTLTDVPRTDLEVPHARREEDEKQREENESHAMFALPATPSWQESRHVQIAPEIHHHRVSDAVPAPTSPVMGMQSPRQNPTQLSAEDGEDRNSSEVSIEVQARQLRARERVVILRAKVLRTRRIRKEKHRQLRFQKDRVRDAINELTRKYNELVALGRWDHVQAELSLHYDELRLAQDELGPAEDAYENLENRLDEEEQDLEEEEDHFYRHNDVFFQNALSLDVAESKLDDQLSPLVKAYQPADVDFQEISLEDQQVRDYLAKVEEADRLKEALDDLESDYYRLSVESSFRKRHAVPLSAETIEFFKTYPQEYKECLDSLHTVEDALLDLRYECIDQGLFDESAYRYESRDALCDEVNDAIDEARERSALRVVADNYLTVEKNFQDKRDYVNKWLLECISDSTIDKILLQSFIYFEFADTPQRMEDLDDDRWTDLVMENWDRDSAGKMANAYFNASKLDAITGEPAGTGNLGAISTTRSRSNIYGYGSAASLNIVLDDDEDSIEDIRTDHGSFTTQKYNLELAETKQKYQPFDHTQKTQKSSQPEFRAPVISRPPPTRVTSWKAFDTSSDHLGRALNLAVEPQRRARSALPEHRTPKPLEPQRKVSFLETEDYSTLRNDASSTAEPSTPFESSAQFADTLAQEEHEATGNSYLHSNASLLSDLRISFQDVSS